MLSFLTRIFTTSRPSRAPSKLVAIVVPASIAPARTPDEEISLRHLLRFLPSYDKYLIAPKGGGHEIDGLVKLELSSKYFGSPWAHGWLLLNPMFYQLFEDYEYILIYHLDALVFRDELLEWCHSGVDYIGSPWIPCADMAWVKEPAVGNGGFALMKIRSVLEVLRRRYEQEPAAFWKDRFPGAFEAMRSLLERPRQLAPRWLRGRATEPLRRKLKSIDHIETNQRNNDLFWSFQAVKYLPEFRVADWKTGLRFGFEADPRQCFELNDRRLPFGCHAWPRYDRRFWEPYLVPASPPMPAAGPG